MDEHLRDPVCGMLVTCQSGDGVLEYGEVRYAFCSDRCRTRFVRDPERFHDSAHALHPERDSALPGLPRFDRRCPECETWTRGPVEPGSVLGRRTVEEVVAVATHRWRRRRRRGPRIERPATLVRSFVFLGIEPDSRPRFVAASAKAALHSDRLRRATLGDHDNRREFHELATAIRTTLGDSGLPGSTVSAMVAAIETALPP